MTIVAIYILCILIFQLHPDLVQTRSCMGEEIIIKKCFGYETTDSYFSYSQKQPSGQVEYLTLDLRSILTGSN
jgi:membrane-bound acyltransferase YfiQ involved in biofilm formation